MVCFDFVCNSIKKVRQSNKVFANAVSAYSSNAQES